MKEVHEKRSEPVVFRRWLYLLLGGVVFLLCFFFTYTRIRKDSIRQEAQDALAYIQSMCQKYDAYQLGNTTQDLQAVINKARVLSVYFTPEDQTDEETLEQYAGYQYLTGIFVLDETLELAAGVDDGADDAAELLGKILEGGKVQSILEHPEKVYADQITMGEKTYDYAVAARTEGGGAVICYADTAGLRNDKNELSLETLLEGVEFRKNAVIVVTDGEKILSTNHPQLKGLSVDECPITSVNDSDRSAGRDVLLKLKSGGSVWYGLHERYRSYYLYVFYSDKNVFSGLGNGMALALSGYGMFCLFCASLWQHNRRLRLTQMEKEYHLVSTIASIYSENLRIQLTENSWEPIVQSDGVRRITEGIGQADEMLRVLGEKWVHPKYAEGFRQFADFATIQERLCGKTFAAFFFESVDESWYQALLIPQRRDRQEPFQTVMLVVRDITEQKRKELEYQEQLRAAAAEAERANAAKTDFLRRMSHDIRTPINGIQGMLTIAGHYPEDVEKQEECRLKIWGVTGYLLDLVNDVLDMSRLETGDIRLEEIPFSISALLQEINPLIEAQTVERGICYHVGQHDIKHEYVIGSPLHLRQILVNIAGNAVKYGKNGGYVNVGIRELSCEGGRVVFEFTCADNGRGMSEEYQAHMFEPFSQEMKSARTNYQGTGLGLAIVKKLLDKMEGDIRVTSEKDKGSTFVVTIPLRINEHPEPESKAGVSLPEPAPLTGIKALLVEDNELNMEIAEFVLEQQGIVVTRARNGKEAVELFVASEPWSFDVILMDIMMPVMDGLEATREIRKMSREDAAAIPIFAMTANAFHDDAVRSREAGMNEHLTKPLEAAKIVETLKKYIVKR